MGGQISQSGGNSGAIAARARSVDQTYIGPHACSADSSRPDRIDSQVCSDIWSKSLTFTVPIYFITCMALKTLMYEISFLPAPLLSAWRKLC